MPQSFNLTPQISDNDLRGWKNQRTAALFRPGLFVAAVRQRSQAKRTEQTVGATFPLRAEPDDIWRQLERMLSALRTQG